MKITSIELHPENSSDVLTLSFRDPKNINPYNVKAITGLDADSLDSRLIALRIGLNPSYRSYSDLRDVLYKMIAASRTGRVQIQFLNGLNISAVISGYISKLEAPHFEQIQEVTLTVQCDESILKSPTPYLMPVDGLDLNTINIPDDESTAPHGLTLQLHVLANITYISITAPADPSWLFQAVPNGGFFYGDEVYLSSEANNKYFYIIRNGVTVQMGDAILPGSIWPLIFPGNNIFSFGNASSLRLDAIAFYRAYWGI